MKIKKPLSRQPMPKHAKRVFQGKIFSVYQWQQKLFDGSLATFEKIARLSSVMVLPVTDKGKIILGEQQQPIEGRFIGAIGGIVDQGEDVLEAGKRELLEETGFSAEKWILWDSVQLINKIDWSVYTFIVKGLKQVGSANLDAGEKIKLRFFSFNKFLSVVADNNFRDVEIALKVLKAKNNPKELKKMKQLFLS